MILVDCECSQKRNYVSSDGLNRIQVIGQKSVGIVMRSVVHKTFDGTVFLPVVPGTAWLFRRTEGGRLRGR